MTVFKNYLKIIRGYTSIIVLYTIIFTIFSIISSVSSPAKNIFEPSKPKIVVINNDSDTLFGRTFMEFIEDNATIVDIKNEGNAISDALFYRKADLVITIPNDFTNHFLTDLNPKIDMKRVPDSYNGTYAVMLLNRFLNIANIYVKSGMDESEISKFTFGDLKKASTITLLDNNGRNDSTSANYFYNFLNFTVLAIVVMIVGMVMNSFRKQKIKMRNNVSPISYKKFNKYLFLGNLCVVMGIWLLYVVISFVFYKNVMFSYVGLLLILNFLVFSFMALSIGFLVSNLLSSKEAINGIVNVIALGSSFISGAFVPQSMLGESVLRIARCIPSYWFIKNNNDITSLSIINFDNLRPIFMNMGVLLIFSLVFIIITNIVSKSKLKV